MRYYKAYKLGEKPQIILRHQLDKTIIRDIKLMQEELKQAEELLPKITQYKLEEQKLKDERATLIEPNIEKIKAIRNYNENYNKGIKYIFKKKELTIDAEIRIRNIELEIDQINIGLQKKHPLDNNPDYIYDVLNVNFVQENINNCKTRIIKYQKELDRRTKTTDELEELRGVVAQVRNKSRQEANKIKPKLVQNNNCPYCSIVLVEIHVDHIYPISRGGLSVPKNMVAVCASCNMKKKDKTLTQFIKRYNLDRILIESNLDILDKEY